jgi:hypothetical protein
MILESAFEDHDAHLDLSQKIMILKKEEDGDTSRIYQDILAVYSRMSSHFENESGNATIAQLKNQLLRLYENLESFERQGKFVKAGEMCF